MIFQASAFGSTRNFVGLEKLAEITYTCMSLFLKRIFFNYRTSPTEFIVPYNQYMESVKYNYSIGMRFKMRFEGEEAPEQRYGCCTLVFTNLICLLCVDS